MFDYYGQSHVGHVRSINEDRYLLRPIGEVLLLVVADGVGGHAAGERASQTTVDVFERLANEGKLDAAADVDTREMLLRMCAQRAHVAVAKLRDEDEAAAGASCTLTAAFVDASLITVLQVGDSRLYRVAGDELTQLTRDQTVANDMLAAGRITQAEFENHPDSGTLTQSLGLESIEHPLDPAVDTIEWNPGDTLLGCSDGLSGMVSDEEIFELASRPDDLSANAQALIDAALSAGGRDNITVVLARQPNESGS